MAPAEELIFQSLKLHLGLDPISNPDPIAVCVALSGGMDSMSLLHGLLQLREIHGANLELSALHVNHGIQRQSESWEALCAGFCHDHGVAFAAVRLELALDADTRVSEDLARTARYRAFAQHIGPGQVLVLGHHQDDQLETLLLRLCRGAGVAGLSGMPAQRKLGLGLLLRPWLTLARTEIETYAKQAGLGWVDDDSNAQLDYDRNYVRHQVLPAIEARWPAYRQSWSKSVELLTGQAALQAELASSDLGAVRLLDGLGLSLASLQALSAERRRGALARWLQEDFSEPASWHQLQRMDQYCERPPAQSGELFSLRQGRVVFSRQPLPGFYAIRSLEPPSRPQSCLRLRPGLILELPNNGLLEVVDCAEQQPPVGVALDGSATEMRVAFRRGGEQLRLPGRPAKPLKKLLQETSVPVWERDRVPLLYVGDQLAYVPGFGATEQFAATGGSAACWVRWQRPDFHVPVIKRQPQGDFD